MAELRNHNQHRLIISGSKLERKELIGRHRFGKLKEAGETVYLCPPANKTQLSDE